MTENEKTKQTILTTMDAFDPSKADTIVDIPLDSETVVRLRAVRLPEMLLRFIENTDQSIYESLREDFYQQIKSGSLATPFTNLFLTLKRNIAQFSLPELRLLWRRTWNLESKIPEGIDIPRPMVDIMTATPDELKHDLYRLYVIDALVNIEQTQMETLMPTSMLDIGQLKESKGLNPEEMVQRITDVIETQVLERKMILRELTNEQLEERIAFAAANQPASLDSRNKTKVLILYACARKVEDRRVQFFDLTPYGFAGIEDVLRRPYEAYEAMVEVFKGDEAILATFADRIVLESNMITPELLKRIEDSSQEPFRTDTLQLHPETGDDSRMGDDRDSGDTSVNASIGKESVVLE